MRKKNICVIGVGRWGKNVVRTINEEIDDMTISCAVTKNCEANKLLGEDCKIYKKWEDIIEYKANIDGVVLAVPPRIQYEIATSLMYRNIPIFMEKPMCLSLKEADLLCHLGDKLKPIAMVNHIDTHNQAVTYYRDNIYKKGDYLELNGEIGAAYKARDDMTPLWEYSPHFIAMALDISRVRKVFINCTKIPSEVEQSGHMNYAIEIKGDNLLATIKAGNGFLEKTRYMMMESSDQKYMFKDRVQFRLVQIVEDRDHIEPILEVGDEKPLTSSLKSFSDAIELGEPNYSNLTLGRNVVAILESADSCLKGLGNGAKIILN
jgi:predicted dehydrogenase